MVQDPQVWLKWVERWGENGGPSGTADYSGQLCSLQRTQKQYSVFLQFFMHVSNIHLTSVQIEMCYMYTVFLSFLFLLSLLLFPLLVFLLYWKQFSSLFFIRVKVALYSCWLCSVSKGIEWDQHRGSREGFGSQVLSCRAPSTVRAKTCMFVSGRWLGTSSLRCFFSCFPLSLKSLSDSELSAFPLLWTL